MELGYQGNIYEDMYLVLLCAVTDAIEILSEGARPSRAEFSATHRLEQALDAAEKLHQKVLRACR